MSRGEKRQEQANQTEAAAGVKALRACRAQPGSSAGVCKEAEKELGRELECILEGWKPLGDFSKEVA